MQFPNTKICLWIGLPNGNRNILKTKGRWCIWNSMQDVSLNGRWQVQNETKTLSAWTVVLFMFSLACKHHTVIFTQQLKPKNPNGIYHILFLFHILPPLIVFLYTCTGTEGISLHPKKDHSARKSMGRLGCGQGVGSGPRMVWGLASTWEAFMAIVIYLSTFAVAFISVGSHPWNHAHNWTGHEHFRAGVL